MAVLLVLGANSDIARAYIKLWEKKNSGQNNRLILASRSVNELTKFAEENSLSDRTNILYLDVADFSTHRSFYDSLPHSPTEVVYAAGVMPDQIQAMTNWDKTEGMIDVNFKGAVSILNLIASDIGNVGLKRIIGISSMAGVRVRKSNFLYGMTKAALKEYLFGLRQHLTERKIQVQCAVPGFVQTKLTKNLNLNESLLQSPDEVAQKLIDNRRSFLIYTSFKWRVISLIIEALPVKLLSRL